MLAAAGQHRGEDGHVGQIGEESRITGDTSQEPGVFVVDHAAQEGCVGQLFGGGKIIAKGTPEEVAKCEGSYTAKYLRQKLQPAK